MKEKKVVTAKTIHPWSKDALLAKAQLYCSELSDYSRDDWQFGLTSTFVLEFTARAAVSNISPALLADAKDWNNIYFSLGRTPNASKFIPRSIDFSAVLARARDIVPNFTIELEGFAAQHINRRNEELHTGATPFEGLQTTWLPHFFETLSVLLSSMDEDLVLLFGVEEAALAQQMISASKDESAKSVVKAIAAHKTVWESKDLAEQKKLVQQASALATRNAGHRVICPACGSDALVMGNPISQPIRKLTEDLIIESQEYLPARFECFACQLKITGLSQLSACKLGATFKSTSTYDAAEYYATEDDYRGYDDDNNEP